MRIFALFATFFLCHLYADDSETLEPISNIPMPPPSASNSVFYRTQQEQFKSPPFRNCGKEGVYKDGRCEAIPKDEDETEQTPQQDTSD